MSIKMITNSDDFGLTVSITDAIMETHLNGIMTSATMMANMDGSEYAVKKAKETPSLGIGIHFNLTEGRPLSSSHKIPLLLDEAGIFKPNGEQRLNLLYGKEKQRQAEIEFTKQIEYLLDNGLTPSHFDSHHHITGTPVAFRASINVAKRYKVNKARITNVGFMFTDDYAGGYISKLKRKFRAFPKSLIHHSNKSRLKANNFKTPDTKILPNRVLPLQRDYIAQFIQTLSVLNDGVTEISFHPGYKNSYPEDSEKTAALRLRDLEIANSEEVMTYIKKHSIKLISFRDL